MMSTNNIAVNIKFVSESRMNRLYYIFALTAEKNSCVTWSNLVDNHNNDNAYMFMLFIWCHIAV